MPVNLVIESAHWAALRGLTPLTKRAVDAALPAAQRKKQVIVLFADDAALKTLNKYWRGKNKPTNVLSFPTVGSLKLARGEIAPLGDIALAYQTVAREAAASGKSIKDHTAHLIVHGVLHLLGYDHIDDADATRMEAKEIRILKKLGIPDPYN